MIINFLTIFPNFFDFFISESIIKKAIEKQVVKINVIDFRAFAGNKHSKVDDTIYGGGKGMLLAIPPISAALETVKPSHIVLVSPQGNVLTQQKAIELSKYKNITFIAGHYEGFDERIRQIVDEEISIGNYILTGGEIPSMVIADAVIRLLPGAIHAESIKNESFMNDDLLDYPQYTRPRNYKGLKVPSVLLNGNHQAISKWRKEQQILKTKKRNAQNKGVNNEK